MNHSQDYHDHGPAEPEPEPDQIDMMSADELRSELRVSLLRIDTMRSLMRERDNIDDSEIWDRDPEAVENFRNRWKAALC